MGLILPAVAIIYIVFDNYIRTKKNAEMGTLLQQQMRQEKDSQTSCKHTLCE